MLEYGRTVNPRPRLLQYDIMSQTLTGIPGAFRYAQRTLNTPDAQDMTPTEISNKSTWIGLLNASNKLANNERMTKNYIDFQKQFKDLFEDNADQTLRDAVEVTVDCYICLCTLNKDKRIDIVHNVCTHDQSRILAFTAVYVCSMWKNVATVQVGKPSPCASMQSVRAVFKLAFSESTANSNKWLVNVEPFAYMVWSEIVKDRLSRPDPNWCKYMSYPTLWGGLALFKKLLETMKSYSLEHANSSGIFEFWNKVTVLSLNHNSLYGNGTRTDMNGMITNCYAEAYDDRGPISEWFQKLRTKIGITVENADRMQIFKDCETLGASNPETIKLWTEAEWAMYMVYNLCMVFDIGSETMNTVLTLFSTEMSTKLLTTFNASNHGSLIGETVKRPRSDSNVLEMCIEIESDMQNKRAERVLEREQAAGLAELEAMLNDSDSD